MCCCCGRSLLQESDGAQCVFTSINKIPLMAVKSDGGYGYDSTDLACIRHRSSRLYRFILLYLRIEGHAALFLL